MADMIKFYKGLEATLPASGVNGALYITTDEGAIYLGTGTGMKRLGDFVQVANVEALPAKAHENCLYYCVTENILAKWNGTEWKQVNKQPTVEELKTLLGLGSMAYVNEVAEANLSAELAAKVNASAESNHAHSNKDVLDGITAAKVTAWDAAEANAIAHADELDEAMNTRVEALEAIDHEHANKALLDTYTQTEANLADAVAKKHEHANATELAKIADGDKAKWDAVAADHLTSADKTTLENAIKEAKKAGTDANTNIETYKVTNDARVLAVEEDVAEITDGTNGILAQAKAYADGKDTAISAAQTAADTAQADITAYKTSNDAALAGVKATAEAAATKVYTDEELAKKVDKVEGKSLVADTEITKLAGVSAGANKVEASETNGSIKIDGVETVVYTHPEKHTVAEISDFDASVKAYNYATKTEAQDMADAKDAAIAEAKKAGTDAQTHSEGVASNLATHIATAETTYETKTDASAKLTEAKGYTDTEVAKVQGKVDALETYVGTFTASEGVDTVVKYIDAKTANIASDETVSALADRVKAIEDDYLVEADKTELSTAINTEKTRAEGIEAGLRTDVDAIKGDYLKAADKTALEGKITAEETRAKGVEESLQTQINTIMNNPDAEGAINSINEFTKYVQDHGTIADGFRTDIDKNKEDIAANTKAIADQATSDAATYETKTDATAKLTEAKGYTDTEVAAAKTAAANQDAVILAEAQTYTDQAEANAIATAATDASNKVDALANGQVATNKADIATLTTTVTENAAAATKAVEDLAAVVYTQEQVDALIADACSWGSF
jgi:hypothetical protein